MATTLLPKAGGTPKSKVILTFPADVTRLYWSWWDGTGQSKEYGANVSGITEYTVKNIGVGNWLFTCYAGADQGNIVYLTITEDDQKMKYFLNLSFQLYASDFDWSSYGTLGVDYEIVDDDDNAIDQSLWATTANWKARLLTSGTVTPTKDGKIDVFCVGGGEDGESGNWSSSAGSIYGGGGGAGYTTTVKDVTVSAGTEYSVVIGANGDDGGETSAFGAIAPGGSGATGGSTYAGGNKGGNGGSGGGNTGYEGAEDGAGGNNCGTGQGTTTREFGEADGRLYASGGDSTGTVNAKSANTGDGGDGNNGKGSPGIVVIRNAREAA